MAKPAKTPKLKAFQKILNMLISGEVVTKEQINDRFGKEIQMYRISTYMWHVKTQANGIIRVAKDGRRAVGYQLMNVKDIVKYLKTNNLLLATENVEKLSDLKAQEVPVTSADTVQAVENVDEKV